jgi:hypothetical protein
MRAGTSEIRRMLTGRDNKPRSGAVAAQGHVRAAHVSRSQLFAETM